MKKHIILLSPLNKDNWYSEIDNICNIFYTSISDDIKLHIMEYSKEHSLITIEFYSSLKQEQLKLELSKTLNNLGYYDFELNLNFFNRTVTTTREFLYEGISKSISNADSYNFRSKNWFISIWIDSINRYDEFICLGELENKTSHFEFWMTNEGLIYYSRVSNNFNKGLCGKYDENDSVIPKFVTNQIKRIFRDINNGIIDWY